MLILQLILVVAVLLALCAFFASGELALLTLDPIRLQTEAQQGSRLARLQHALRSRPERFLMTIQIGSTAANMALATFCAAWALRHLSALPQLGEGGALAVSTVGITVLTLLFGELIPKTVTAINSWRMARFVTYPLAFLVWLLTPVNWLLGVLIMPLVHLLSGGKQRHVHTLTRDEVGTVLAMALAGGQLHRTDAAVAREAIRFSEKNLADVMTPRVDIVAIEEGATVGAALDMMTQSGFTRLPVYRGSLDEIIGALLLKDLVRRSLRWARGHGPEERWVNEPVAPQLRQVAHFPLTKSVVETLAEIRQLRLHLAVVVDEHGGTAGIVTLEDILEELVGDIRDETDHDHSVDVLERGEDYAIVTGRARLEQLPELAGIDFSDDEAATVGGLLMERLGRPAVVGDQIQLGDMQITALKVLRTRVKLLRIEKTNSERETRNAER